MPFSNCQANLNVSTLNFIQGTFKIVVDFLTFQYFSTPKMSWCIKNSSRPWKKSAFKIEWWRPRRVISEETQRTKSNRVNSKFPGCQPQQKHVHTLSIFNFLAGINFAVEEESSSESEDSDEESNIDYKTYLAQLTTQGLPQQFWAVQKLVRYLRIGNQTATVIALCNLVDFDLEKEYVQAAIMEAGKIWYIDYWSRLQSL